MNEIRTLMEKFWICRDSDKETFYKVKRDIPNFQRFIREQLGWKLIHTEKLLKLEKKPAHAEAFMGISEFTDIRDYCILCVVLMYLEDAEEGRQFLLSELIDYVETQLKNYMPVDWTSFTQRKSLVRVLQYMERLQMLRVYEGKSESFSQEAGQEVLYENTGYSKYFTSSFTTDISGYESWKDFEKTDFEEFEENRGSRRINRVYRQLAVCPALYWDSPEDADALYLKNQRQWVGRYLRENMGGNLFNFLFSGVLSMVVALLLYRAAGPASAIGLAGFLLSILFGIFISYHILYLFAMSAFWVTKPWYIQTLVIALTRLFGGGVIPIWLYPDWLKAMSDVLPFRFITYEPIQIFLGNIQGVEILHCLMMQWISLIVLVLIEKIIWRRAANRVFVQGG